MRLRPADGELTAACECRASSVTETEAEDRAQKVETADDDDESESGIEMQPQGRYEPPEQTPEPARYKKLKEGKQLSDGDEIEPEHEEKGLSGAQDAAIAGIMNTLGLLLSGLCWLLLSNRGGVDASTGAVRPDSIQLRWRPSTHLQWWFAMLGGGMNFLHYFFFLKAFEGAPSTVLLPLVQVASVSVFLGSSVVALLRHEPWITPTHALAYLLMFIGGATHARSPIAPAHRHPKGPQHSLATELTRRGGSSHWAQVSCRRARATSRCCSSAPSGGKTLSPSPSPPSSRLVCTT